MRKFAKKRSFISKSSIFKCFTSKDPFKKDDVEQKMLLENLTLLIVKNHLLLQFVETVWLKYFVLQLCPCVQFLFHKLFSNTILHELVEKLNKHMFCMC